MRNIEGLMPISRDEYDRGQVQNEEAQLILNFLRQHRDMAFTSEEIVKAVYPDAGRLTVDYVRFRTSLIRLQAENLIETREISGTQSTYYIAK